MTKKVRFGIIGTGRISDWVLRGAALEPRFEAVAVCSRSVESGDAFASSHGIRKVYTDVEAMASDPDIDAIYIGTPNNTHKDLAVRCLARGKHVLCEKPLASNASEVREMAGVAKENGVLLMEAMISTLNPNFLKAQKTIGSLGRPRHYFASFCQYSSKYDALRQILSGGFEAPVPSSFNPDCSGGALADIGIYTIYPMVALFGKPSVTKASVTTCEVPTNCGPRPIDLQGAVTFEYADGLSATVLYSKIADSKLRSEVSCEDGIVSLDQMHICRQVDLHRRGAPTSGRSSGPVAEDITVPGDPDEYLCEFREFIDLIEQGRSESANNSLSNSLVVAEVMDEIRRQAGVRFPADS